MRAATTVSGVQVLLHQVASFDEDALQRGQVELVPHLPVDPHRLVVCDPASGPAHKPLVRDAMDEFSRSEQLESMETRNADQEEEDNKLSRRRHVREHLQQVHKQQRLLRRI